MVKNPLISYLDPDPSPDHLSAYRRGGGASRGRIHYCVKKSSQTHLFKLHMQTGKHTYKRIYLHHVLKYPISVHQCFILALAH